MRSPADASDVDPSEIERAAARIASGRLVAFPTETVWGLAADAGSREAVAALARFKGRELEQATSVLVSSAERLAALACVVDVRARAWVDAFWPGPLTLVLACSNPGAFAPGIANERGEVGVRCSPHAVARALALACEARGVIAITATSCNVHGQAPASTRAQARAVCESAAAPPLWIASGPDAERAEPSTVVATRANARAPSLVREGAIALDALRRALSARGVDDAIDGPARPPAR